VAVVGLAVESVGIAVSPTAKATTSSKVRSMIRRYRIAPIGTTTRC
jgi:hypothetical protein